MKQIILLWLRGDFPQLYSDGSNSDFEKLLSIEQWGDIRWKSMRNAFANCTFLIGNAIDLPILSQVADMGRMFFEARSFNQDIGSWDVSTENYDAIMKTNEAGQYDY